MKLKFLPLSAGLGLAMVSAVACTTTTTYLTTLDDAGPSTGDGGSSNGGGSSLCETYCAQSRKAGCEKPSKAECVQECESTRADAPSGCRDEVNAMLTCGATATFSCDDDGKAASDDCNDQGLALLSCLQNPPSDKAPDGGKPSTSDGGGSPSTGSCYTPEKALKTKADGVGPASRCTKAQVNQLAAACISDTATNASCMSAEDANPTCWDCVVGAEGHVPAILSVPDAGEFYTTYACVAVATGHPECAKQWTDLQLCVISACATCSDAELEGCTQEAAGDICDQTITGTCRNTFLGLSDAQFAQCHGASEAELFTKVATQLCVVGNSQ